MAKKSSPKKELHELVVFKHKDKPRELITDRYQVEKIQNEDKIKILNSFSTLGIHFRYSILINNENSTTISDIKIDISYPNFLEYSGSYPQTVSVFYQIESDQDRMNTVTLKLERLTGNSEEHIYLHFTPTSQLAIGEFNTVLSYKNNRGKKREIKSDSISIELNDIAIMPKIISHSRITQFSKIPGMKRALLSLGIGTKKKLNSKKIYDIFEDIILTYNFQLITKDREKGNLWFFGTETKSSNDLFAISKIGSNFIELIAHSTDPVVLGQFLFSIDKELREKLSINKIIKPSMKLLRLECINCGTHLPYFPKKGESIKCMICSYEQVVW
ncbi:MAG: hypothetical protein ACFFDB_18040 [Promethearchaeota archaeon]